MVRIRKIEIQNFRSLKEFTWLPSAGINCLIGPGDSGKSSILDAIDFCLGARRNVQFTDADFHRLDVMVPISISVTIGELHDDLRNFDAYGLYLRSFHAQSGLVEDEPEKDAETALTVHLSVGSDLEPSWSLVSARAEAQGQSRNLGWNDRLRLSPTRIGVMADYHLSWRRGSVLNRVSDERADASAALVKAARDARAAFGDSAQEQLETTLEIVANTATELGIPVGDSVKAMLDAHSVSLSGGTISLHDETGIPLRGLGIGSTRLLIAGLQRKASAQATIILIDELEHGLEPHRIIRFLGSLGAKEKVEPLQVFMTTHSPVALRELSGSQLFVLRSNAGRHEALTVGTTNDIQSTIRLYPDAFLAPCVIVCEGASEVGLLRGLDQYEVNHGHQSISARGVAIVDCGGGEADRPFKRAEAFRSLGYRVAVLRDDDTKPTPAVVQAFKDNAGKAFQWREGRALEDELFFSLSNASVLKMIGRAVEIHGDELVDHNIRSASQNATNLNDVRFEGVFDELSTASRAILGKAARTKKNGWFKSVAWMEDVARDVIGPDFETAEEGFKAIIDQIFAWTIDGSR